MAHQSVRDALEGVSAERIRRGLFDLCRHPLPFRKVNCTRPGVLKQEHRFRMAHVGGLIGPFSTGC